ncbi:hypothetical protein Nepgr_024193 [Nepenthes gracilis]|uniref:Germin-like protein n=1 Tax=Nepenthes gracilis TaxID=150966 RepID=A0AAD3XZT7_NEPGR|nr:hypothetical protein Nepgr_024193 [Nepenthes gracilis]
MKTTESVQKLAAWMAFFAMTCMVAYATDPTQLQDFCVAINHLDDAPVFVNGLFCKNPANTSANDFLFQGLNVPRNTKNKLGSNVTIVSAANLPGLNTLGISMARVDFAPYGLNPLHIHPHATEILTVVKGTLFAGFVSSNQDGNRLFSKVLYPGDVFVFPQGLIHFELNIGKTRAVARVTLSSQNPGVITVANATFGSKPPISVDVLTKAFQVNKKIIKIIQSHFS